MRSYFDERSFDDSNSSDDEKFEIISSKNSSYGFNLSDFDFGIDDISTDKDKSFSKPTNLRVKKPQIKSRPETPVNQNAWLYVTNICAHNTYEILRNRFRKIGMCGIKFVEKDMYAIIKFNNEKDAKTAISHYNDGPFCFTLGCKDRLKVEKYAHQDHV